MMNFAVIGLGSFGTKRAQSIKNSKLAKLFGAMKTPHVYLFNKNDILVYRGAIDDNAKDANKVNKKYLEDAIISSSKAEKIKVETTKALGCSIKF